MFRPATCFGLPFVVVLLAVSACSDRAPAGPTAVASAPTFTVTGIVRDRLPGGGVGDAVRGVTLEALANLDVVATAITDANGVFRLTGVAGTVQIRVSKAGYDSGVVTLTAITSDQNAELTISPQPRRLAGTVVETPPTQQTPIAGARVLVTSGSNIGASTQTDAGGAYALSAMWGEFDMQITCEGYTARTIHVIMEADEPHTDVQLGPVPRIITTTFDDASNFHPGEFVATMPVHNPGEIAITDWSAYGFEEGDSSTLQIWEDGQLLAETHVERSFPRHTIALRVRVSGGKMYQVRVEPYGWWYTLAFTYPN